MTILDTMKRITLAFIFIGLTLTVSAQEIDMKRIDFVNKFYKAVVDHEQSKVIKCTDKAYRKEQLVFLADNKEQFVNELFGGTDVNTNEYVNLTLSEIENIEIQDVFERGANDWEYVFHIKSGDHLVERSLLLRKTGKRYGFVGSVG